MSVRIRIALALLLLALSAYGWWFHFTVGPSHGSGMEMGIVAGVAGIVAIVWGGGSGRGGDRLPHFDHRSRFKIESP
jgi:hypothetical protein